MDESYQKKIDKMISVNVMTLSKIISVEKKLDKIINSDTDTITILKNRPVTSLSFDEEIDELNEKINKVLKLLQTETE